MAAGWLVSLNTTLPSRGLSFLPIKPKCGELEDLRFHLILNPADASGSVHAPSCPPRASSPASETLF